MIDLANRNRMRGLALVVALLAFVWGGSAVAAKPGKKVAKKKGTPTIELTARVQTATGKKGKLIRVELVREDGSVVPVILDKQAKALAKAHDKALVIVTGREVVKKKKKETVTWLKIKEFKPAPPPQEDPAAPDDPDDEGDDTDDSGY